MGIFRNINESVEKIPLEIFEDYVNNEALKETFYSRTIIYLEADGDGIISYCPDDEIPLEYSEDLPAVPEAANKYYYDRFMEVPIDISVYYPSCKSINVSDNILYENSLLFFNKVLDPVYTFDKTPLLYVDFSDENEITDGCPGVIEVVNFD